MAIGVGLIGLGTVGSGVYKLLTERFGAELNLVRIAVRDASKTRALKGLDAKAITTDPMAVVNNPAVQLVVEVVGGVTPTKAWVEAALSAGKHVVTANKELMAKHGPELMKLADTHKVRLLFEGAVAGGIPIILPLKLSLAANRIEAIAGILNGTTNYILTKMAREGLGFDEALKQAQDAGFAEADPTNDVEGFDTAYKIALLSSIAYGAHVDATQLYRQGITEITDLDIRNAASYQMTIKLVGLSRRLPDGRIDVRVHPMLVPDQHPLAAIHNEYNAVWVKGDAVGEVMFSGKGAGELPTASAVMGDILAIANDQLKGNDPIPGMQMAFDNEAKMLPMEETRAQYYIRLNTLDQPGVLGNLGAASGEAGLNVDSMMQRARNADGTASIMLITHEATEKQVRHALDLIRKQPTTTAVGCVLRIFSV